MSDNNPEQLETDWEWEWRKLKTKLTDVWNEIDELKAKDRSLSARISRLRAEVRRELYDEEGEEGSGEEREGSGLPILQPRPLQAGESARAFFEKRGH